MKGFVHVVEIIIVYLLVFAVVLQFSAIPKMQADWSNRKLTLQGNDLLFSLDKLGINWFNATEVKYYFNKTFAKNQGFSLKIKNVIKPDIRVGCICTLSQKSDLENILKDFEINNVSINFVVELIPPENIAFPLWHDVIFIWGYNQYLEGNKSYLLDYLENDKGVVELVDLTQTQIDSVQQEIFRLKWDNSLTPTGDNITFSAEAGVQANTIYTIQKYFYHFPKFTDGTFSPPYEFENFLNGEKVNQKDDDQKKIVLSQKNSNAKVCIVNYGIVNGKGRTVWISEGNELSLSEEKDILLKALVSWAAGNEYLVVKSELKNPLTQTFYKVMNEDMFQPIEIILTLGYFY